MPASLSYDGWVALSLVAGEVKNPKRNLPVALALGLALAIAIYVLANVAYLRVLTPSEIAATPRVGALVAERTMGQAGGAFVSVTILFSIVGAINGWAMTAPRIYFAQARDGLFFRRFGAVHPRFRTPHLSILMFGAWSALLAITGTYETLASYAMYAAWVFYGLTALGVAALRRKEPDRLRPYRMTGYPVTLAIFAAVALGFVVNTFLATPGPAIVGYAIDCGRRAGIFHLETEGMTESGSTEGLGYEPRAAFAQHADPSIADCQGKRIGILVVTYNAITTLVPVLKRIPPSVWSNVEEVVVFDDASPDGTFELAMGLKAVRNVPKLHVLKHPKNLGYGGNQKAGYRYFIEKGFDIVVLLHGDGQYAPEILAQLYRPLVTGEADAVFGSRMMRTYGGPLKGRHAVI